MTCGRSWHARGKHQRARRQRQRPRRRKAARGRRPAAQLTPRHNACGDLEAVGGMLGWLMVGREAGGEPVAWRAEPSPAWAALGRPGDEWRGLFNVLLNPHPPAGFGLEDVKGR